MTVAPRAIDQTSRIAELLERGYTHQRIGSELGVSGPRIAQIIAQTPALRRFRSGTKLERYRDELRLIRADVLKLAALVRDEIRALDEELQSIEVDRVLGLRQ